LGSDLVPLLRRTQTRAHTATANHSRDILEAWRARHIRERRNPKLKFLIWQSTIACNLRCSHCAAPKVSSGDLTLDELKPIFDDIASGIDTSKVRVGITGGEPLIRRDLHLAIAHLVGLGFKNVGIVSNGFLLGRHPERLDELVEHGLGHLCVSLDGLEEDHNRRRRHPKSFQFARAALERARTKHPKLGTSITVSVSSDNYDRFHEVVAFAEQLGVPVVKIVAVMPYRRAAENSELILDDARYVQLLQRVAAHRRAYAKGQTKVQVTMTDDGFVGAFEGHVRDGLFNTSIGVSVATLWHDGRLAGCPQIPQDFNFQGDLRADTFARLWREEFKIFRNRAWLKKGECRKCEDWRYCMGGSLHDRDMDGNLLRCNALRVRNAIAFKERVR
jgi:radical SAM protein with 4Fe4S-binding SPASM domain